MLNVLITRPTHKAQMLAKRLANINIAFVSQPLFDYQPLADTQISQPLLTHNAIIIFISVSAVEFANSTFTAQCWRYKKIIAVGKATKQALEHLDIQNVICPEQENSEGLLALPALNKRFAGDAITIVRGNSGREHLADTLTQQGAKVTYLESYQCLWRSFAHDIAKQWFELQINCILVTSNAILERIIQLTLTTPEYSNNQQLIEYWRDKCLWVVASKRIAIAAKKFGLTHVIISNGASEDEIINTLQQLENENK